MDSEELIIVNLVLPIIKDLVLPKIKSLINSSLIKESELENIEKNIEEYLLRRYEKYLIIDTLVFPNKQTLFKSLYEPLTLISQLNNKKEIEIKITGYPENFISEYFRIIIEDTAGMGKSTVTKKLFLSIIEEGAGIPILIELRQINSQNDFIKEIQTQFSPNGKKISLDIILELIYDGKFIFLFDGFDEISKDDKGFVIKELHKFIEKSNKNYFLITSRPEDSLTSFGDFHKFKIKPLKTEEAYSLLNRYDLYSYNKIAVLLVEQLKQNRDKSLEEYLTNPFLVSLLYKSFDYKKDIPLKKCQFYRQVFDALFESHDLSKEGYLKREKYSNLNIDDFERILRHFAFLTTIENKVEYDKNYIINKIDRAKTYTPDLNFSSSDLLKDLIETVPLFKKDGNYIKWAHKSLQDFFSAKFIWIDAKINQEEILKKIYNEEDQYRFDNLLDLFLELDPIMFENTILFWFLEGYKLHSLKMNNKSKVSNQHFTERIELTYLETDITIIRMEDFSSISKPNINLKYNFILEYNARKEFILSRNIVFNIFSNINHYSLVNKIINKFPYLFQSNKEETFTPSELEILKSIKEGTHQINENMSNEFNIKCSNNKIYKLVNKMLYINNILQYSMNSQECFKKHDEISKRIYSETNKNGLLNW